MVSFALDPTLDSQSLHHVFKNFGRIHIPGILTAASAEKLYRHLAEKADWHLLFNVGELTYDLTHTQISELSVDKQAALMLAVEARATDHFQYMFESVKVPDTPSPFAEEARTQTALTDFHTFMNSQPVLDILRTVTGDPSITYADAQATAYGKGHFLTKHDDNVTGKHRRVAYVLNLTPNWNPDWGGLLQFLDNDGHITEAYAPKYNALNLFIVPQAHSVSYVTPFAKGKRYAVTGWLRAKIL